MMTAIAIASLLAVLNTPLPLIEPPPSGECELHADAIYLIVDLEAGPQERVRARVLETLKGEPKDEIDLPTWSASWNGNPYARKLVFVFDGKVRGVPERQRHGPAPCVSLEEGRHWFDMRRYPITYHRYLGDKADFERAVIFVRAYVGAIDEPTPERLARLIESDELAEWQAGMLALSHVRLDDRSPGWDRIGEALARRLQHNLEHLPLPHFAELGRLSRATRVVHERHEQHGDPLPEWRHDAARVYVSYALRTSEVNAACVNLPLLGFDIRCERIEVQNPDFPRRRPQRRLHIPQAELDRLEAAHGAVFYRGVRPDVLPEPPPRPRGVGPDTPWPPSRKPQRDEAPYCPGEP